MLELLTEWADFAFMRRALAATTVLSASIAPVGAFLVLRRLSLAGEAMAHAITPGVVVAFVTAGLSVMSLLIGGLIAGLGVAALTSLVARFTILRSDASLASLYLIALALGVFVLSAAGSAVPLKSFLFGSILGVDDASMLLIGGVATVTLTAFVFLLRPLIVSTLDPTFFEAQARRPELVEQAFMLLVVLNLLAAFKTLGTLMAVGLMILPATSARYWSSTITGQLALGFAFCVASCWIGLLISFYAPETPSGPCIVLVAGVIFFLSLAFGPLGLRDNLRARDAAARQPEE